MTPDMEPTKDWSLARRIAFRFALAYLLLYNFPFPLNVLPGAETLTSPIDDVRHVVVPWVGKHVLHLAQDITVFTNGSGDTTFDYVQVLLLLVLAGVATGVGSVLDRRRTRYTQAHDVLRTYVRYVLAVSLLSYGMAKVIKTQFAYPAPYQMAQPLGEFSPMGLLWTFMGYSSGYNLFTGGAEVLGGLLLLFRRTTTLGALVVTSVMSNVVALNFFYDVPVKLYSSHLLLMAVFLVLPELGRLANVLVLNRPTSPTVLRPPFALSRRVEWAGRGVKLLFVGWLLYSCVSDQLEGLDEFGDFAPRSPLHGLYVVESFTREGQAVPLLLGDATCWKNVAVNSADWLNLRMMDDSTRRFVLKEDPEHQTLTLTTMNPETRSEFTYARPDPEHLHLRGTFQGQALEVHLRKASADQLRLVLRGFNWIQERPYHR